MKKLFFILLIGIIGFLTPSAVAHAKGIDAPPATENSSDEIFMTYDEFTQLYYYGDNYFKLKKEFYPYYDKILKERYLERIYRVEGETMEFEYKGKTYDFPLYEIGQLCIHLPSIPGTTNEKLNIFSKYEDLVRTEFTEALYKISKNCDTVYAHFDTNGIDYYMFIVVFNYDEGFDETKNIGIVIHYKFTGELEKFADYKYPTHDEYYEEFSGKPYQPAATSTPKPTNTPTPKPTKVPTPTPEPTKAPTPTPEPTKAPTPTPEPTKAPTPTPEPTKAPTPTPEPTKAPTPEPTKAPTPTLEPTKVPTVTPSPLENDTPDNNTTSTDAGFFTTRNIIIVSSAVIIIIVVVAFWVSKKKK